ncbi:DUF5701 family protein [Herbiconiux liangxiaofengii]|uniref:DUF5701 family protein n=1 Tax=Herbiconiux liangxiaofengii TaxID=3342795 RepID=UPI0035BA2AEE
MTLTIDTATTHRTPPLSEQVQRLIDLGLPEIAGISAEELRSRASTLRARPDSILVVGPAIASPAQLMPLLRRGTKPGFVVDDLTDLDEFASQPDLDAPEGGLSLVHGLERGDDLLNRTPDEALPEIVARGRRPLTVNEGISWLLQQPEQLAPNHCFMTIASRRRTPDGSLDARVPALWISGGTGRDGRARRGAAKLGWCWAGNRHRWLGHASASID